MRAVKHTEVLTIHGKTRTRTHGLFSYNSMPYSIREDIPCGGDSCCQSLALHLTSFYYPVQNATVFHLEFVWPCSLYYFENYYLVSLYLII